MLSLKQLQDICLLYANDSRRCRYLGQDDYNSNVWYCNKKGFNKAAIDDEVSDYLKEQKRKGNDPKKNGYPLGDNCPGYPVLKHINQGYDI